MTLFLDVPFSYCFRNENEISPLQKKETFSCFLNIFNSLGQVDVLLFWKVRIRAGNFPKYEPNLRQFVLIKAYYYVYSEQLLFV